MSRGSLLERIRFWRTVGRLLETPLGARAMTVSRGLLNAATRLLPRPRLDGPPSFVTPTAPLRDCRVAIVTTAGLHLAGDEPFDVDDPAGDPSFREIPSTVSHADLRIAHAHYPHRWWREDPEVLLPLSLLRELEAAGAFRLAPRFFSFGFGGLLTGAYLDPRTGTAHEVAHRLRADGVDLALFVPA